MADKVLVAIIHEDDTENFEFAEKEILASNVPLAVFICEHITAQWEKNDVAG